MPPDPLESRGHWPLDYHSHLLFQSRLPTSKHFETPEKSLISRRLIWKFYLSYQYCSLSCSQYLLYVVWLPVVSGQTWTSDPIHCANQPVPISVAPLLSGQDHPSKKSLSSCYHSFNGEKYVDSQISQFYEQGIITIKSYLPKLNTAD